MKIKLKFVLVALAVCLGFVGALGSSDAQASSHAVPYKMRGTWYHYQGHGQYYKIRFTKHTFYSWDYRGHGSYDMKRFKVYAYKLPQRGWYTIASPKKVDGAPEMYRYSPKTINGKAYKSLQFKTGIMSYRYFKTKIPVSYNKYNLLT